MAALSDTPLPQPQLMDLRQIGASAMQALLDEETATWERMLDWDFRPSASLVRRFVDMQALTGHVLAVQGRVVGYSYFVCEERKGLIGDLYVMEAFANVENETLLLGAILDDLVKTPSVRRVESQLMMLRNWPRMRIPYAPHARLFKRQYMELDLGHTAGLPSGRRSTPVAIDNWTERRQDEAATLIADAYRGHIDSEINDQYRSPAGARRFLLNIVQYPGCGSFFQPASFVALDPSTHRLCGLSLSSLVHADIGHITQICVSNAVKGHGVGYELMRHSLESLEKHACRKASLTVTSDNLEAIRLYEQLGFRRVRNFAALVWEGF
ncbi:MAG TPA: GNAT family N-acetyltransferase [Bryobacteraceae bacterium]|nr:GNAT family N-acetyltransferase [Bryobacteraceae bacterium]